MVERGDEKCFCDPLFMTRGDERYFCNHVIRLDEKVVSGNIVSKGGLQFFMVTKAVRKEDKKDSVAI
jgi:hypothetical protein